MKLISCVFNFDTANVEMLFDDGSPLMIDCNAIENQFGTTMRRRSELDWLIYNEPLSYAQMLLDGRWRSICTTLQSRKSHAH